MRNAATLIVVAVVAGIVGGWVGSTGARRGAYAEDELKYPYLSESYNMYYTPTWADWQQMTLNVIYDSEGALSDKLIMTSSSVFLLPSGMNVHVDTKAQPSWSVYQGNGRFSVSDPEVSAAYSEAAEVVLALIRIHFPAAMSGLGDDEIEIAFFIQGAEVGTWSDGNMRLEGEA